MEPTANEPPMFVNLIPIISAQEMFEKVATNATENDIISKEKFLCGFSMDMCVIVNE